MLLRAQRSAMLSNISFSVWGALHYAHFRGVAGVYWTETNQTRNDDLLYDKELSSKRTF